MASALSSYIESTPEVDHHALLALREGDYLRDGELDAFSSVTLRSGTVGLFRALRSTVTAVDPDVIHAHSSYAGLVVRVAPHLGVRIVYTPHCYAFERRDLAPAVRTAVRVVERILAGRGAVVAACSPREAELARTLDARVPVVHVPNVSGRERARNPVRDGHVTRVVAIGRVAPQKDPALFAQLARVTSVAGGQDPEFVWVGGADRVGGTEELVSAGVRVTGWLPRSAVVAEFGGVCVYVHTALWEGFPMSVLEAVDAGVPVLARRTPTFSHCPQHWTFATSSQFASALTRLNSPEERSKNVREWRVALSENTQELQRERLLSCYTGGKA